MLIDLNYMIHIKILFTFSLLSMKNLQSETSDVYRDFTKLQSEVCNDLMVGKKDLILVFEDVLLFSPWQLCCSISSDLYSR